MTEIRSSLSTGRWTRVAILKRSDARHAWPFVVVGYDDQGRMDLGEFKAETAAIQRYQDAVAHE